MYICICKKITDSQIKQAIDDGLTTMKDLRRELDIASECGKCGKCTRNLLKKHTQTLRIDQLIPFYY